MNIKLETLERILEKKAIRTVYQPIVSLENGSIFGYEALSRITDEECTMNIEELFSFATDVNYLWDLDILCRTVALKSAASKPLHHKLFLNVDPNIMNDPKLQSGFTNARLNEFGLDAKDIIFEITERTCEHSLDTFSDSIHHYRKENFQVAIDDFGSGYSGLHRVCAFSPEYIKISKELISGLETDPLKESAITAVITFCKKSGIKVIAEGIETEQSLRKVIRLGVDFGQGYYLGYPKSGFQEISSSIKQQIKTVYKENIFLVNYHSLGVVDHICSKKKTISCFAPSLPLYELMRKNHDLTEIFVVDENNHVCGIMTRDYLLERFGGEYGYNLSRRLTMERLMQKEFLAVERSTAIEDVASLAMERKSSQTYHSIAVTENGMYYGTVTVKDLLLNAIKLQVKRASDANPLSGLPGNTVIQEVILSTYQRKTPWSITYLDLDNFKAFNDAYGFSRGDDMIKALVAAIEECTSCCDFKGHIGGDDFVIVSHHHEAGNLCQQISKTFFQMIASLYTPCDWASGYILSKNRNGFVQQFPIATISMAVISNLTANPISMEELSMMITHTKKKSKQILGNSICFWQDDACQEYSIPNLRIEGMSII